MDVEIQRIGAKTETVRSCGHVGHSLIGFVVEDPHGWMALPCKTHIPTSKERSRSDAIDYVKRSQ